MELRNAIGFVLAVSALALTACPAENKTEPTKTAPQPATPGSQPAKTSTGAAIEDQHGANLASRDQIDPDGVLRRGAHLSDKKAMTVDEVLANVTTLDKTKVKVTGKVETVCEEMGCWFIIGSDTPEHRIRITSNHSFYVPRNAVGRMATIEGELEVTSDHDCPHEHEHEHEHAHEHAAKDGDHAKKQAAKVSLVAAGITMNFPSS